MKAASSSMTRRRWVCLKFPTFHAALILAAAPRIECAVSPHFVLASAAAQREISGARADCCGKQTFADGIRRRACNLTFRNGAINQCAPNLTNGPSVMVTAHCLIAIRRKVRLGAHRLIVA